MSPFYALPLSVLLLASCGGTKSDVVPTLTDNGCNAQICDYLYAIEYDDYDFAAGVKVMEKFLPKAACSEVRKGNFVGRNLDWYINHDATAVIKVNATEGRHASLGVVGCAAPFSNEVAASGQWTEAYNTLPFFTVDGINDQGLYIGVNVMPTGETSCDSTSWETGKWGHGAAFTRPEAKETFCVTYLVRVVLDRAASVAEAKALIDSINWYEPAGFPHEGESQSFHWLICDGSTSAVVEFLDNKLCLTETDKVSEPSYATIMTNFTNKVKDEAGLIQPSGAGYERWDVLHDNYAAAEENFEGIQELMKKVWYTQAYTKKTGDKDFWFTEFTSSEFPAYAFYGNPKAWEVEGFKTVVEDGQKLFADKANWHADSTALWYSTHTSVYNIAERKLHLITHEGLDAQKDFYTFTIDDTFNKPLEHKHTKQ